MVHIYLWCIFTVLIKFTCAKSIQVTVPTNEDVYEAGHAMLIEWYAHRDNNTVDEPVTIVLASGAAENLTIDRVITNKTASLLGYYSWTIPRDIPPRRDYVIEVGTNADDIAFAGYITINNKDMISTMNNTSSSNNNSSSTAITAAFTSLPTPIQKPLTTSILTAFSPTRTATPAQAAQETTIFLNGHTKN